MPARSGGGGGEQLGVVDQADAGRVLLVDPHADDGRLQPWPRTRIWSPKVIGTSSPAA